MPELAILIVNWNVRDLLQKCLASVYAQLAHDDLAAEVWTVDNGSQDGSAEMVHTFFPQVSLLVSDENLGFAGGNNLALRAIGDSDPPQYVLLLNPDTELRPGALGALMGFMEEHPLVGVAGVRLFYGDGGFQHGCFGFPGLRQILFDLYPLPGRLYETRLNGRYPRAWYERGRPFPVDHPLGAVMMVRWDVIRQVGVFDEGFHMYCEEIDWCMRIKRSGWHVYCVPIAEVTHYTGQSASQVREKSFINLWRSRRRLYDKHYGGMRNRIARHLVRVGLRHKLTRARRSQSHGKRDSAEAASEIRAYSGALSFFD